MKTYVCKGEQNPATLFLQKRVCAETGDEAPLTQCQFVLTGNCTEVCEYRDPEDGSYANPRW